MTIPEVWEERHGGFPRTARILGGALDASAISPDALALHLERTTIPDGELAKLPNIVSLRIHSVTQQRIDLSGMTSLRFLSISWVRGLDEIVGMETLRSLEVLMLHALPRVAALPSLAGLDRLWWADVSSMKGLPGIGWLLDAPSLRELQLGTRIRVTDADALQARDHDRLVGFLWFDAQGVTAAQYRALLTTIGRRNARMLREGPPPEHELPAHVMAAIAPTAMVSLRVEGEVVGELQYLGAALLDERFDYGDGPRTIRVRFDDRPASAAARLRVQEAKRAVTIEASGLPLDALPSGDSLPARWVDTAPAVVRAVEAASERIAETWPSFAIAELLERLREQASDVPSSASEVRDRLERAEAAERTQRTAMHRTRAID